MKTATNSQDYERHTVSTKLTLHYDGHAVAVSHYACRAQISQGEKSRDCAPYHKSLRRKMSHIAIEPGSVCSDTRPEGHCMCRSEGRGSIGGGARESCRRYVILVGSSRWRMRCLPIAVSGRAEKCITTMTLRSLIAHQCNVLLTLKLTSSDRVKRMSKP